MLFWEKIALKGPESGLGSMPISTRIYNLKQTFLFSPQMRKSFRITRTNDKIERLRNGKGKEVGYSSLNCVANRYCDESICFVYCLSECPTFSIVIQQKPDVGKKSIIKRFKIIATTRFKFHLR